MNQKGIAPLIIVTIIVVAAVAVGGAVLVATRGGEGEGGAGGGGGGNGGGNGGNGGGGGITGATSLQFDVYQSTTEGVLDYTFMAKNIGTSNMMMRIDGTFAGQDMIYIINGAQEKFWVYAAGTWIDYSEQFSDYWDIWSASFEEYETGLSGWTGGTWTSPDGTVTISNIQVNPSLDDSLFEH